MPLLEVCNVTKRFGGLVAVKDISLHVDKGEIVGLIGPNGAGKTTLFNIITGYYPCNKGFIKFGGEDISRLKAHNICKKGIARTFQLTKPFFNLSVVDNIATGALFNTNNVEIAKREAITMMDQLEMTMEGHVLLKNLTLVERRYVELARALATRPKMLLLDEIAAGLNPAEIKQVTEIIQGIRKDMEITLFWVEHVMRAIMATAERIIVLNEGEKIADGSPEEITNDSEVIKVYLGEQYF